SKALRASRLAVACDAPKWSVARSGGLRLTHASRTIPRFPRAGGAKDRSLVVERRPPQADKRGPR
ncbi:MAG: hypothetical protein KJ052_21375, partial [Candidatus Hydrogenedentes bacterium]|nr:hypothetical protein [Candidatus Hydrogenedentota bacterium]